MLLRPPEDIEKKENKQRSKTAIPISSCLAKTIHKKDNDNYPGLNVETHCKIVGLVAKELIKFYPEQIRKSLFPDGTELVAAAHDIGKLNPLFQEKIYRTMNSYKPNSFPGLENINPELEKNIGYHNAISQAELKLLKKQYIPEIAGSHHGFTPMSIPSAKGETVGGPNWHKMRVELLDELERFFSRDWPEIQDDIHAAVIAGLTTVSDWIGSGSYFDTCQSLDLHNSNDIIQNAIKNAGFVTPQIIHNLAFSDIFPSYEPRPMQDKFISHVDKPGIYILEALMGEGKTEAALYAAYKLLESGLSNGIYFALPTQLTSEKIYERMNAFLKNILKKEDKHRSLLVHGRSWLYESDLGENAKPGYSWFNPRKRKILSPFSVGTIDQALMAVMNVKHGFVRTFGLAGKVVILDEVHTYDSYTGTIMDHLIKSLAELGCTVILLSATLSYTRKQSIVKNYVEDKELPKTDSYPLITKSVSPVNEVIPVNHSSDERTILVTCTEDEERILTMARNKAADGENVLWIENTVFEAQQVYKKMAAWGYENNIEVGLIHSRFPQIVRKSIEDIWVSSYGKEGIDKRTKSGRILIGTQVLEQSLDIDGDFLITRIAPTDMLLQRIGRLWRHRQIDSLRPKNASPKVIILSPSLDTVYKNPEFAFGPSGKIYSPYVLYRSLECWQKKQNISIPNDMRKLIEATYAEKKEKGLLAKVKYELNKEREKLQRFAFNSMAKAGNTLNENAAVRYSEVSTCEVLIIKQEFDYKQNLINPIDGEKIYLKKASILDDKDKKEIIKKLTERIISVPSYLAPDPVGVHELRWLSPYFYISNNEEERIRIAVLDKSGKLVGLGNRIINENYEISYSPILGYVSVKK